LLEGVAKPGAIYLSEQAYWNGSISRLTTSATRFHHGNKLSNTAIADFS